MLNSLVGHPVLVSRHHLPATTNFTLAIDRSIIFPQFLDTENINPLPLILSVIIFIVIIIIGVLVFRSCTYLVCFCILLKFLIMLSCFFSPVCLSKVSVFFFFFWNFLMCFYLLGFKIVNLGVYASYCLNFSLVLILAIFFQTANRREWCNTCTHCY